MIWTVEYSISQRAFHVDTVDKILEMNRRNVAQGIDPGFIPLYIAATIEDANAFVERWKHEHPEVAQI